MKGRCETTKGRCETARPRNKETAKQRKGDAKLRKGDAKQRKYETTKVRNYERAMRKSEIFNSETAEVRDPIRTPYSGSLWCEHISN